MINIKTAATIVVGVAVTASSAKEMIARYRESKKTPVEKAVEAFYSQEFLAFNRAQAIMTDRALNGYYDEKTNDEYMRDFDVLHANFLTK